MGSGAFEEEEEEECFLLLSPPTTPTPFPFFQHHFNPNPNPNPNPHHHSQSQDWKERSMNSNSSRPKVENLVGHFQTTNMYQQPELANSNPHPSSLSMTTMTMTKLHTHTFGQRTSIYRGVTRHRWTGRYEAHLWDSSCKRDTQSRKGKQVYLGGYDKEEKAARAYDLAAFKYWGTTTTTTNFPISDYEKELEEMKLMTRQELVASLRRKSSGFSRGASIYRGVTRHHQHGKWQARIGTVAGNKGLYLGTFSTQEEAAEAYDIAAIKFRGLNAVTNFETSRYDIKTIMDSAPKPLKNTQIDDHTNRVAQPLSIYPYAHQRMWSQDSDVGDGFNDRMVSVDSSSLSSSIVPPMIGNDAKAMGYDQARNLYYQSSWDGIAKTSFYNNWMIPSDDTMAVCHGVDDTIY